MSEVYVKGLAELQRALDALPAKIEANIMRGALRAGAKVLADAAKANIHGDTGGLAKSVRVGTRVDKRLGRVAAYVRAGGKGTPGWYAHIVERGSVAHWIAVREDARPERKTRRGLRKVSINTLNRMAKRGSLVIGGHFVGASIAHPGAKAKPFMRPALDGNASAAVEGTREYIRKRLRDKHGIDVPEPLQEGDE